MVEFVNDIGKCCSIKINIKYFLSLDAGEFVQRCFNCINADLKSLMI